MAGARMKMPLENKVALLQCINEKKKILFAKFSSEVDNGKKGDAWNEVLVKAKSLQLVTETRDSTYVRDKLWGLWKTRALEKKDNSKKTGKGGGREKVLTEVDNLIFNIIGKESPVLDGLPVGETGRPAPSESPTTEDLKVAIIDHSNPVLNLPAFQL